MARPQFVAAMASTMFASRTKPCFNLSPARLSSSCRPTCFLARPSLTHSRIYPCHRNSPYSRRRRNSLVSVRQGLRSEEHTSELQSRLHLVCRLLLEKKKRVSDQQHTQASA